MSEPAPAPAAPPDSTPSQGQPEAKAPVWAGHPGRGPRGQLGGGHDPGLRRRDRARRAADRVHHPERAARLGRLLLQSRQRDRPGLGRRVRGLRGHLRGLDLQPAHGRCAVPAGVDGDRSARRRTQRGVQPAVRNLCPGHPADPGRAGGGGRVPGRPVQHRRPEPVHRGRDRGHLARLRGQPAGRHPRRGLRDRRLRGRCGAGLDRRAAQGPDRRARGHRHDHAQLHHGVPPGLPAGQAEAAGEARLQRPADQPDHRQQRAPAAAVRHPPADQRRVPARAGLRGRRVVAAEPEHAGLRVPHRRRQPQRGPQLRHERDPDLDPGHADRGRPGRPVRLHRHPGHRLQPQLPELRHLRDRRDHGGAAGPVPAGRRGLGRPAARCAARRGPADAGLDPGPGRHRPGHPGPDRHVRGCAAAGPSRSSGSGPRGPAVPARSCPKDGTHDHARRRRTELAQHRPPLGRACGLPAAGPDRHLLLRSLRSPGRRHAGLLPAVRQGNRAQPVAAGQADRLRDGRRVDRAGRGPGIRHRQGVAPGHHRAGAVLLRDRPAVLGLRRVDQHVQRDQPVPGHAG